MNEHNPGEPHPFEPLEVSAAIARETRITNMQGEITAILGHTERIEKHLDTLNHRTEKNENNLADVRSSFVTHVTEIEAREEYSRIKTLEADVGVLKIAAIKEGTIQAVGEKNWALIFAIIGMIASPAASIAVVLIKG